jgi:hypothetical protein
MNTRCANASLSEAVLEAARAGRLPVEPHLARHLESCRACRVSVEQLRRLADTWSELQPSRSELAAAHVRFVSRQRRGSSSSARPVSAGAALVLVFVVGSAFAALRVAAVRRVSGPPARIESPRSLSPAKRPPAPAIGVAPVAPPSLNGEPRSPLDLNVLPAVASSQPTEAVAVHSKKVTLNRSSLPSAWSVAAAAMRDDDYATAERAFSELTLAQDQRTREAARLARAQVWLAEGRISDARAELEELAKQSLSSVVRQRASEALRSMAGPGR